MANSEPPVTVGRKDRGTSFQETAVKPTLLVLAVFFALDVLVYFYIAKNLAGVALFPSHSQLEFRNPYYGLESMYQLTNVTHSRYPKQQNMPRFTSQIDAKQPNHVSQIDPHRWLSPYGLLSPPDRHLEVSETVSRAIASTYPLLTCPIGAHHFAVPCA